MTSQPASTPSVSVTRDGHRRFTGRSQRGGVVAIGDKSYPDTFTPGELLKVALAACAGFSAEQAITRRLGEDAAVAIEVGGDAHATEDRYDVLTERIELDLSSLDESARARLITVIGRAIDQACTVGRTLEAGAAIERTVEQLDADA
ncbi:OsmC family protein [Rarobacter faecitabidus]|uniref:Putative OsmC-like protein n=1 Tax=Rarobacter faecitabidus TaxID=13243 RepID=A0A542ZTT4_RARFA|nr:OsmC family protein [Rarobacter faecitabidus]TQL63727.1 putative OsmC-like protein [Rarobacter faecitabidus]